ncbi:hypothetical protein SCAR479_05423 [Seiridium cardinale]|uniref:Polyketide synthase n=1 Tax=Seiridium cardinale TaxID=138064 RepID=A0ABR2XVN9_9PEZI
MSIPCVQNAVPSKPETLFRSPDGDNREYVNESSSVLEAVPHVDPANQAPRVGSDTQDSAMENPICIVGLGCRLPGEIASPSELWDFIANKKSAQGPVPKLRFNIKGFHHPDATRQGTIDADGGYFLSHDVRLFDNSFFGISNLEATHMDPQQRQLLEVAYECFEHSGIPIDQISGTSTGVYVGNFTVDYQAMQSRDPEYGSRYTASGEANAILANRISHVFNLHGPSCSLDTACSSSLYALHTAIRAIQVGDCDGALVAGVNLITSPEQHLGTRKAGVLSPTSTCHTFDISADGYGRAEAVNAVYLKPLRSAINDGDRIWAVIRGSATNDNGRTPGIAQPSAALQEAVIRKAYSAAGLDFSDTDYVECHGTGTAIGDPIEVDAIASCFCPREGLPLMLGSVKTSLGHSEAASGLTSVLKVALAFEKGTIPPTYGVKRLNPKCINSFGFGGANAHIILESPLSYLGSIPQKPSAQSSNVPPLLVLPVSAASKTSLDFRVRQIIQTMEHDDASGLERLALALALRRSHLQNRRYLLVNTETGHKREGPEVMVPKELGSHTTVPLPIAFVFTGQGAQYAEMARGLLYTSNTFSNTICELDNVLQSLSPQYAPDWTLKQTIVDPPGVSRVNDVNRSQPICTAIQVALVNILRDWGITPVSVVGHSSGEIAAAYSAGLLTSTQAILVAYFRGYAAGQVKQPGRMVATGLGAEAAHALIVSKGLEGQACVACVNASNSVTLSGTPEAIDTLEAELANQNVFVRKLMTGVLAYHSHLMKEVGPLYEQLMEDNLGSTMPPKHRAAKMYSSVADVGSQLGPFLNLTGMAKYWRRNLEQPVHFSSALENLISDGLCHLIEIGPHSALKGPIQRIRTDLDVAGHLLPYANTLIRGEDATLCMQSLAGSLFVQGHKLDWYGVNGQPRSGLAHRDDVPTYPWDYSAGLLWYEPRASIELRNKQHVRHEILGSRQLADDGISSRWRNILHPSEMPWLRGHKVETQMVFPATGYLAAVMEAMSQIIGIEDAFAHQADQSGVVFEFRNVNINAALIVHDEDAGIRNTTELHTVVSKRRLSSATSSSDWYDFSVSSWRSDNATLHCVGGVRVNTSSDLQGAVMISDADSFEAQPPSRYYDKGREEGICYDGDFRSLTSLRFDRNRQRSESVSTTRLIPMAAREPYSTYYPMHPITMDACLQAPIIGCSAGNIDRLEGYLPVFISECQVRNIGRNTPELEGAIHTRSTRTGFSTQRIDTTLRDPCGRTILNFKDVRLSLYSGKKVDKHDTDGAELPRQPCLRALYKPDISRLFLGRESAIDDYIVSFVKHKASSSVEEDWISSIEALVDLAGHRKPDMQVIELCSPQHASSKRWLRILDDDTGFPLFHSWCSATVGGPGQIRIEEDAVGPFLITIWAQDLVVIPKYGVAEECWAKDPKQLISLIAPGGTLITRQTDTALAHLRAAQFEVVQVRGQVLLATRMAAKANFEGRDVIIVTHRPSSAVLDFAASIADWMLKHTDSVAIKSLDQLGQIEVCPNSICVSLLELEREFLASMEQDEMNLLRKVTNTATNLLWMTGANILGSPDPNLTLADGFSRALMLEQPSLRFSIVDVGSVNIAMSELRLTCESLMKAIFPVNEKDDKEFVIKCGLLYISRFGPEVTYNAMFRSRLDNRGKYQQVPLSRASPAQISIGKVGVTDMIHFQHISEPYVALPHDYVEIDVKVVGLNAKDIYTMSGRVETRANTTACEFGGVVTAVGSDVDHVRVGDRVVVLAPNHFQTLSRVPAWAVYHILPDESFTITASLPIVYATALYALEDCARLRAGESVLIHSGAGALGLAVIQLAKRVGAVIYTTVGSQTRRDHLLKLGIPDSHIFSSRDTSFVKGIRDLTAGKGVDVIINSLVGDLMHASWDCVANFGRFIELGKRELIDAGKLDMRIFLRNASFMAVDITELYYHEDKHFRDILSNKVQQALNLYRSREIKQAPITTFDVSDITQAYRYFHSKDRVGKVMVSLENPQSLIPLSPSKYRTVFHAEKIYLLVGGLGGLGRSISRWMMARGARAFCFLSRSGCDKLNAQKLVNGLREAGANVIVVRGDVALENDVVDAVAACQNTGRPIGGVIQAAMGLKEAIFTHMTNKEWKTAIEPKWRGTWNLHNALEGHDQSLDFFLLTSSLSGSIGTATESNYCASNSFLDAFARWRRSQGKTAVSVGLGMISEVGYLHEHPDIEALLLRRGIHPLNGDELLQIIDLSLSGAAHAEDEARNRNDPAAAHILTGLEPFQFYRLRARGFEVTVEAAQDPRMAVIAAALETKRDSEGVMAGLDPPGLGTAAPWLKNVPSSVVSLLMPEVAMPSLHDAIVQLARKRFANLILTPADQIGVHKPLSQFGLDSMIAAEFRTWFWSAFKVDIPFLNLLASDTDLHSLAGVVEAKLIRLEVKEG